MTDPNILQPALKAEAPEVDRIKRQDLKVSWVRYIRGGVLGRYTEAVVEHPSLGKTTIVFGLPMSRDAVAGWIETFVPKRLYREMSSNGYIRLGVPDEGYTYHYHRYTTKIAREPRWSHSATSTGKGKTRRLACTILAPKPPKPKGEWEGDPIRDRKNA